MPSSSSAPPARERGSASNGGVADDDDAAEEELPTVLLLGGLGMVGVNLLKFLVDHNLARYIRVVDKRVPAICDLSPAFVAALAAPQVEFVQADVSIARHVARAFSPPPPSATTAGAAASFTIVVNAAAETSYGYLEAVYERNILEVRRRCAAAAAAACEAPGGGCECYIEVSTAQVYRCSSRGGKPSPATEAGGTIEPWTTPARFHAAAEAFLRQPVCAALPWVVVRLPVVYGPADRRGLMPRLACAATYARTGERMELLWGEGLRLSTVHAQDAAAAIWHVACTGRTREVYNICDDSDTSQGSLNKLLEVVFGIRTGFYSRALSSIASVRIEQLAAEANAAHMAVWADMLRESGIAVTPVSPYLEPELLFNNAVCISNAKLKSLGFTLSCPKITPELLAETVAYWTEMRLFPPKDVVSRGAARGIGL